MSRPSTREIVLLFLVVVIGVAWFIDRQKILNREAAAVRKMDQLFLQVDKLTAWIRSSGCAKNVDVNYDMITITGIDGKSFEYDRKP